MEFGSDLIIEPKGDKIQIPDTEYDDQDLYDTILDYRDYLVNEGGYTFDYLRYIDIDPIIELIGNYFYHYNPSNVYRTDEFTSRELDDYALFFLTILDEEGYRDKITDDVIYELHEALTTLFKQREV